MRKTGPRTNLPGKSRANLPGKPRTNPPRKPRTNPPRKPRTNLPRKNRKKYRKENTGSVEFQVLSLTNKMQRVASHLELHKKDFLSERGLRKIVGKRKGLLVYLSKKNRVRYNQLIGQLDIQKTQTR